MVALILTTVLILTISIAEAAPKRSPERPKLVSPKDDVTVNLDSSSSLSFQWTISGRATAYTIEISGPSYILDETENNYYSAVLVSGDYAWRIRATNEYGESKWTSKWEFTTITPVPTPTPTPTPTAKPTPTAPPTPTPVPTATPKPIPTSNPTPTSLPSPTPSPTPTTTTSPNQDNDPKPTPSPKPTLTESIPSPSPTSTLSPTSSPIFDNQQPSINFEQRKIGVYAIAAITLLIGGILCFYVLFSK